jgi:hypothetical protein
MNRTAPFVGQWLTRAGRQWPWVALGGVLVLGVLVLVLRSVSGSSRAAGPAPEGGDPRSPGGTASATNPAAPPVQPGAAGQAGATGQAGAGGTPPSVPSPTVRIVFRTVPARQRSFVTWGSKRLGFIDRGKPLVLVRPRDSGPLDVVVRSEGFIPVHTRANTFDDSVIDVKLTPLEKKETIYGYKQPLAPPPDAGVPLDIGVPLP